MEGFPKIIPSKKFVEGFFEKLEVTFLNGNNLTFPKGRFNFQTQFLPPTQREVKKNL